VGDHHGSILAHIEHGHLAMASGEDASAWIARARTALETLRLGPSSPAGRALARLEAATW
jgi:hypothetical protein